LKETGGSSPENGVRRRSKRDESRGLAIRKKGKMRPILENWGFQRGAVGRKPAGASPKDERVVGGWTG